MRQFFSGTTIEESIQIIRRQKADYLMVHANTPLDGQLRIMSGFTHLDTPGDRYSLYEIDRKVLGN